MLRRVRIFYKKESQTVKARLLPIKEWVRCKVNESLEQLVYKDDFSAIYCRNLEKGVFAVYAHTHRDAQRAMRKFFTTL